MSRVYLYAIIPAAKIPPLEGVWPSEPQVRTIHGEALAAIVGRAPPVDFHGLSREDSIRYLLSHQRVVESVMRMSAALPVKFGTTLPDDAAVASMLARGAAVLAPPLAEHSQHIQLELVVSWDIARIVAEAAAEDAIAALKAAIAAQASGATSDQRLAIGKLVKDSIDRRRESCRSRIVTALRSIAADLIENTLMDDRMVANLALLLAKGPDNALNNCLGELDAEFGGRLNFRCIGPLPPYSFATVEVNLPSFEAIDRSRRALSLGERAALAEIKSAYHREIRRVHPDLTVATSTDAGSVLRLNDAYKILLNYAQALPSSSTGEAFGESECRFDRDTIEDSIQVMVRRQESTNAREEIWL